MISFKDADTTIQIIPSIIINDPDKTNGLRPVHSTTKTPKKDAKKQETPINTYK